MKKTTQYIINLRKQGKTYKEIMEKTGLSKANISYVCKKYVPDNAFIYRKNVQIANDKIPAEQMAAMRAGADAYYKKTKEAAIKKWESALQKVGNDEIAYMSGLYDGEGNHKGTGFNISNSEPKIVFFIINFLEKIGAKYYLELCLHASHIKEDCIKFWQKLQFRAIRQHDNRGQKRNYAATENYGTVYIYVIKPLGLRDAVRNHSYSFGLHAQL